MPTSFRLDSGVVRVSPLQAKAFGAFYTDPAVAAFLLSWAVRSGRERVLDPSFGGGVFLEAALERVRDLGGASVRQDDDWMVGVELDCEVHASVAKGLAARFGLPRRNLIQADFFDISPQVLGSFDVVVGNPPFIRFQRVPDRAKARTRALEAGVELNSLASSWAPFIAHSVRMLRRGGRLAMVVPSELMHASYARPLLGFLRKSFASLTIVSFRVRLFPQLGQDTVLLLADEAGESFTGMHHLDLQDVEALASLQLPAGRPVDPEMLSAGQHRFALQLVCERAAALYLELAGSKQVRRLGALARIGIGYVTGANRFFHLSPREAASWKLPHDVLHQAVFRGRAFQGLRFTRSDWEEAAARGDAGYLFLPQQAQLAELPARVRAYVQKGVEEQAHLSYKCRQRQPWFLVPQVRQAGAFLSYMSSTRPSLVANDFGAVAPNTLLLLQPQGVPAVALASLWQSSLTSFSAEVEGHALGGGLLKLEPGEARQVLLPGPGGEGLEALAEDLGALKRQGRELELRALANQVLLQGGLGLSASDCRLLEEAAQCLRERRQPRRSSQS